MTNRMFGNSQILAWLQYYSDNTQIDLERVKILDITRKNKNLIPTVESNDAVLVFTEQVTQTSFTACGAPVWASATSGTTPAPSRPVRSSTASSRT